MITNDLDMIKRIVDESKSVVFFGGAGVSTASGIPDFRGVNGLYSVEEEYGYPPERMLSHDFLYTKPETFYKYYREKMIYPHAEPNEAHKALAELEWQGKLTAVITQNIDGLHQAAGSENVIELHGSVARNYCIECRREYSLADILEREGVPHCSLCGALVRPDVTMYGEALDSAAFYAAEEALVNADVLIVGGTSLTVNPAASLVASYPGEHLIIINKSPTPYDEYAEYVVHEPIERALRYIARGY